MVVRATPSGAMAPAADETQEIPEAEDTGDGTALAAGEIPLAVPSEVTFLPSDPPRASRFCFFHLGGGDGARADRDDSVLGDGGGEEELELVLPARGGPHDWLVGPGPDERAGGAGVGPGPDARAGGAAGASSAPPGRLSLRRRLVRARLVPMGEALEILLDAQGDGATESWRCWSAVLLTAVNLIARGRLQPAVTAEGNDAWVAGPLDPGDLRMLEAIAAAFPPLAHPIALPGASPLRVGSSRALARAAWDAAADTLVRTPAAAAATGAPSFASIEPTLVEELRGWLDEATGSAGDGASVSLRVELGPEPARAEEWEAADGFEAEPARADEWEAADGFEAEPARADEWEAADGFDGQRRVAGGRRAGDDGDADLAGRAVVQMTSPSDPSLVVDAGDLFTMPGPVLARFGEAAESDLLLALRRGGRVWPPLGTLLDERVPAALALDDDLLADLLLEGTDALSQAGIEVLWPAELVSGGLSLRAVATPAPEAVTSAGLGLTELLEFHWEIALGGEALSPEELSALAEAKRGVVRLRGRFVVVDPALVQRAAERRAAKMTVAEALGGLLAGKIEVGGELVEVAAAGPLADLAARLRRISGGGAGAGSSDAELPELPGLMAELRPYQRRGTSWLSQMTALGLGACLADDMGLGKTIQVIALHLLGPPDGSVPGPTLVVCPTSLLGTWERELRRFAPAVPVRRFHGSGRHLDEVAADEVVLTTYGVLRREVGRLGEGGFRVVVADEAQHAKNPLSDTARALRKLPAGARVALTGTPVENRLTELWSILDWTTPGLLGPLERFRRSVAVAVERNRDPQATERLAAMVRPFLLRRRKSDPLVAPELPERTVTDLAVPLSTEQATLYEAEVREALAAIAERTGIARQGLVLRLLTVLKQICNHPAQYLHQQGPIRGRSGKLTALTELLDVILAEGESVLVFSQFVEMCTIIERHLAELGIETLFLHGAVPARRRDEMVAAFQAAEVPVFILSLKAGGVGLNLTKATHVIHYDRWWNPAVEDQASDRAHRIGQTRAVQIHRLVCEGTLEDRIAELLERKRSLAEAVVGEGEGWIGDLSDEELAELVRLGAPE